MKVKIITALISTVMLLSCGDSASTSEQTQNQTQEIEQSQVIEQSQGQLEEQTTDETVEVVSGVEYDIATLYLKEGYQPYSKEMYQSKDFDGDGTRDFILAVFKSDSKDYESGTITLQVYKQKEDTNFELVSESGSLEDLLLGGNGRLSIKKNVISVHLGQMRYDNEWKFRYDKKYDDYVLIGSEYNSYGNAANDGSGNRSINYLAGKRIDQFNEFDYEKEELIKLDPVTIKVPSTKEKPVFLKDFNADSSFKL